MEAARSLKELVLRASRCARKRIVVVKGDDETTFSSAADAIGLGIGDFTLVGDGSRIRELSDSRGINAKEMRILDRADDLEAAGAAINEVKEGRGDIILKGNVKSHTLLKEILKKENGLKRGLLSDCLVTEDPASNRGRLIGVTDGGVNIEPSLAEKIEIVRNAIFVFQRLGFEKPLVAALSAVETPVDSMRSSTDAAELKRLNLSGVIKDCVVEGPLALDNAISVGAAAQKGVASEVAGRADILLVPNIESGNLLGKSLFWFSRCPLAHVIIGARVPVLIPSRTEDCESKSYSIALGVLCA